MDDPCLIVYYRCTQCPCTNYVSFSNQTVLDDEEWDPENPYPCPACNASVVFNGVSYNDRWQELAHKAPAIMYSLITDEGGQ